MTAQATLDGLAPAPVQTPAHATVAPDDTVLKVAFMGWLERDATLHDLSDGSIALKVLLRQSISHHPQALPVRAGLRLPDLGSFALNSAAARHKAQRLRAGVEVAVVGLGLERGTFEGKPCYRVLQVRLIDLARPTFEATSADAAPSPDLFGAH